MLAAALSGGKGFRSLALTLAPFTILLACSASGEPNAYSGASGGSNNQAGSGGQSDAGWVSDVLTGDVELDPDASCATATIQGERVPLDMYFMLDTSGSMAGPKLELLKSGLSSFLAQPDSADLGVAGQQFPIGGLNESCDENVYGTPAVPWSVLPNASVSSWIGGLVAEGYTPSIPALQGAVNACKARMAAEPSRKCTVVFVSDGEPEGHCSPVSLSAEGPLGDIAADAYAHDISVFAVSFYGISATGQKILVTIAQDGGTQVPFAIKAGSVDADFVEALAEARGTALGCEYQVPTTDGGVVDPDYVRVIHTAGEAGEPVTIPRLVSLDDCQDQGWAYDDNDAPTKLVMCPASCDVLRKDSSGKVDILLGCKGFIY